jgi:hypothetical protein
MAATHGLIIFLRGAAGVLSMLFLFIMAQPEAKSRCRLPDVQYTICNSHPLPAPSRLTAKPIL